MLKLIKVYLFWLLLFTMTTVNLTSCTRTAGSRNSAENEQTGPENSGSWDLKLSPHPRLFFPRGQEAEILRQAAGNSLLSDLVSTLKDEAERKLRLPPQAFTADGRLLHVAREEIDRILTLSMAYRLFKDTRYAGKVEKELLNVCGYANWSPSHFLDVAEMTTAVAIGYDWCYDFLQPSTRTTVENAIIEKAFTPAWPLYEKEGKTPFNRENNWNMVCNGGMVNGAIAIGDKYPQQLEKIVRYAVKYTPNLLECFAPEGVFNEGPGYWSYNGMYMALLFDNLNRNIRNDYGLPAFEGLENTARYYMEQIGPSGSIFNYGDASDHIDYSGTFFFLSRQYKQPVVAEFYRGLIRSALGEYKVKGEFNFPRFFFLAIPWFDDSPVTREQKDEKLTVFNGVTDLLIFNGGLRQDNGRLYLASKTGRSSWSHNQLDGGSFVLDCDGERWGIDIGPETYSLPDFWDYQPGGVRWNYFRNTNMAHSTISIDNRITNSDGQGEITRVNKTSPKPWGIFDLSPCYQETASLVQRGFRQLSPKTMLVRDEITLKSEGQKVSWRFVTRAEVTIEGNRAVLSQNGKTFYLKCLLPWGFQMKDFPAAPYSAMEKPVTGVNIVEILLSPEGKQCSIPVLFSNRMDEGEIAGETGIPLAEWE